MARFSEEQIEQVRQANDVVDVIGSYVNLKRSGSGYVGLCPFHNEKSPSFSVSPSRQMYKCFGCGVGGNVITFLMEYENYTFPEAMESLASRAGIDLPKKELTQEQKRQESMRHKLLEINARAANYYYAKLKSADGKIGYEYLKERGLGDETILRFGLGYAGQNSEELYNYLKSLGYDDRILRETGLFKMDEKGVYDKFWNRVMFPIMDVGGKVIGFGGRVMGDAKPKYLNSPETKIFDKSRNLFGLNYAKQGKRKHFILCEGYMDVISLHQAGFTEAVASLGTAFTEGQATIIKRYTDEVLLTYDSDEAGVKAALRALPILRRAGIVGKIVHLYPHKDPDEFIKAEGKEAFEERMNEAENGFMFELSCLLREYDRSDPEQNTKFIHGIARKLLIFEDKVQRDSYMQAASAKYNIPKEDLGNLVLRYANQEPEGYRQVMEERNANDRRQKSKKEGIAYSYRLLLSWLIEDTNLYPAVSKYIQPRDFLDENFQVVAQALYEQLEQGSIEPARILNMFEDLEQQKMVAEMFQTNFDHEMNEVEKEKAINEMVHHILEHSIDYQIKNLEDPSLFQELMKKKKELQTLGNIHISIKNG